MLAGRKLFLWAQSWRLASFKKLPYDLCSTESLVLGPPESKCFYYQGMSIQIEFSAFTKKPNLPGCKFSQGTAKQYKGCLECLGWLHTHVHMAEKLRCNCQVVDLGMHYEVVSPALKGEYDGA
jgi:hypothetical protein